MKCPVCGTTDLVMAERQGVEIDYCPQCRGVWLDRGELDKILERSLSMEQPRSTDPRKRHEDVHDHYDDDRYDDDHYKRYPQKKKNWLGEVFDIFE
jgi:uncharacterized protein